MIILDLRDFVKKVICEIGILGGVWVDFVIDLGNCGIGKSGLK